MAWGENKATIVQKAIEGEITHNVPASFLQLHPNSSFVLEGSGSTDLSRIQIPWTLLPVEWNQEMTQKAVIWLARKLNKAILKLTDRDYMDNGMSDLVLDHEPSYNINIQVFKRMQRTITGWSGGKPGVDDRYRPERAEPAQKRILIFSPHPDDDVISMGGTFQRLVDQNHIVHTAYQTSGNIAVFDEDAVRFADFVTDINTENKQESQDGESLYHRVVTSIRSKKPGEIDTDEVLNIKALIRKGEARAACRYVGVPDERIHFLNLPFYETGTVKKRTPGEEDFDIVMDLIQKVQPQQIFAAGDLSDPHGTHRVCLQVIIEAISRLKNSGKLNSEICWVWLYRGAWQEYPLDEIGMAVPLSPDEVVRKRKAIFKHQSQKDTALFPGVDQREFWQRAEARNALLAKDYDGLGLQEYSAIEAFKRFQY
jgi:glucosamine-6-phosphate deaminase